MKTVCLFFYAALLLPIATSASAQSDEAAMAEQTNGFYAAYMALPHDGIPDAAARGKLAPFLTPALTKLLADGEAAEALYAKETKNQSPPIIEGDVFSSLFEGATTFKLGACKASGDSGSCAVDLTYEEKGAKPTHWTDTAILARTPSGWRIGDIAYGGNWDFGNKGRLSETLKFALKMAANPDQ